MKKLETQLKKKIANVFNNGVNKKAVFDMCIEFISSNKNELNKSTIPAVRKSLLEQRLAETEKEINRLKEFTGLDQF